MSECLIAVWGPMLEHSPAICTSSSITLRNPAEGPPSSAVRPVEVATESRARSRDFRFPWGLEATISRLRPARGMAESREDFKGVD